MQALGAPGVAPEGRFHPDTYAYSKGSSDLAVLKRAYRAMQKRLDAAWAERAPDTPLKSADEALVLASIVEKETGVGADRGRVAGVFVNRLRIGMPLQTDPTVIYGLGAAFDGNLRKRDLLADTPYNTYTRPACRRRRSRCRARRRCSRRCIRTRPRRCTSSRAAMAAANSARLWPSTIAR